MANDNQALINDFIQLRREAAATAAAMNQVKGQLGPVAGGGGGLSSNATASSLGLAGSASTTNSIATTTAGFGRGAGGLRANRNAVNTFNTRDASQILKSSTELTQDIASGDPASIGIGVRGLLKDLRVGGEAFNQTIGTLGIMFGAAAQGFRTTKNYNKTQNQSILEVFGGGAASAGMGFAVGGPVGAIAATAAWTTGALYSAFAPSERIERRLGLTKSYDAIEKTTRDFGSIYGAKIPTAETILSEVAKGEDSRITEDLAQAAKDIDEGYKQTGLGNFEQGEKSLKKGYLTASKYGLLNETQIINLSAIYSMLESQRFAVRYFAQTQGSLAASRTGD